MHGHRADGGIVVVFRPVRHTRLAARLAAGHHQPTPPQAGDAPLPSRGRDSPGLAGRASVPISDATVWPPPPAGFCGWHTPPPLTGSSCRPAGGRKPWGSVFATSPDGHWSWPANRRCFCAACQPAMAPNAVGSSSSGAQLRGAAQASLVVIGVLVPPPHHHSRLGRPACLAIVLPGDVVWVGAARALVMGACAARGGRRIRTGWQDPKTPLLGGTPSISPSPSPG